jgi:hypothetical protein
MATRRRASPPAHLRPPRSRHRLVRDTIHVTLGVVLLASQVYAQLASAGGINPDAKLITAGITLLVGPALLHVGDARADAGNGTTG